MKTTKQISETILNQLGNHRFITMTGAKDMNYTGNALHFKFGSGAKNKANHCSITLQSDDTYMVDFHKVSNFHAKHIGSFRDIYVSNLKSFFTEQTGMETSL